MSIFYFILFVYMKDNMRVIVCYIILYNFLKRMIPKIKRWNCV